LDYEVTCFAGVDIKVDIDTRVSSAKGARVEDDWVVEAVVGAGVGVAMVVEVWEVKLMVVNIYSQKAVTVNELYCLLLHLMSP
jgi:hypothetical protein